MAIDLDSEVDWFETRGRVVALVTEPSAVVEFEGGRRVTIGLSKLAEVTPEMRAITVPETLSEAEVLWAFRHGVVEGMRRSGRWMPGYPRFAAAHRDALRLMRSVSREWTRRHSDPRRPWKGWPR